MAGMLVVEVVVETTGVGGAGECGCKLSYPPAQHISPSCHICVWHVTNWGQSQEHTVLATVIGPKGNKTEPIRDLPWGFSI